MWVTQADEKASQADVVKNIMRLRQGGPEDHHDEEHCGRGLEHMRSQAHMDQRKIFKDALFDAVLDEQDRQIGEGIVDDEALAEVAARMSQRAKDAALALASSDEAYVRRYRKEEEEFVDGKELLLLLDGVGGSMPRADPKTSTQLASMAARFSSSSSSLR